MNADQARRLEEIFDAAVELPAGEREAFVAGECGEDEELRTAVRSLLRAHERADGILDAAPAEWVSLLVTASTPDGYGWSEEFGESVGGPSDDRTTRPSGSEVRAGPYRLLSRIGRGGMGAVYLAEREDGHFRQRVAVKLIHPGFDAGDLGRRFLAERQILASLQHPNIAHLLDGGITGDGRPYLVMEYVDGVRLDAHCDHYQHTVEERLRLFVTVAGAVHHAHRNLIVHRDLKPSNILVTTNGVPKLLDFGIAKLLDEERAEDDAPLTVTGIRPMTPEYASPEQLRGDPITTATDVFGLGLVLYELLTGRRPFAIGGGSVAERERLIGETDAPRMAAVVLREPGSSGTGEGRGGHPAGGGAGVSDAPATTAESIARARRTTPARLARTLGGDLERIVAAALRKEPERRYPSAEALAADIAAYLEGRPVWARGDSTAYRATRFARRHRWGVAAGVGLVLLLAGYAVTATLQAREIRAALGEAQVERDRAEGLNEFLTSLFQASDPAESRGDSITARELLQRGVERAELLAGAPLEQARMFETIGSVYASLGNYDLARPLLDRSLALRETWSGPNSLEVARSLDALGEVMRLRGEYEPAEAALRRALAIHRELGADELALAKRGHDLAVLLADRGEFTTAREIHLGALEVRRRLLGDDHLETAESLAGLAFVALQTGDAAGALPFYEQSLEIRRRLLGDVHPDVAVTMNNLGSTLANLGDYEAAAATHLGALEIRRRLYGENHPAIATTLNNLARVRMLEGDFVATDSLLRDVLEMRRRLLGEDHPAIATAINNLAFVHYRRGDHAAAEPLFREVIAHQLRTVGDRHPNTGSAYHNLGLVLRATGRRGEAESAFRESIRIREIVFAGADHADLASVLHELGEVLAEGGDAPAAALILRRALEMRTRLLGPDHEDTRASASALAMAEQG